MGIQHARPSQSGSAAVGLGAPGAVSGRGAAADCGRGVSATAAEMKDILLIYELSFSGHNAGASYLVVHS